MNPIRFALRRPVSSIMLAAVIGGGGVLWLSKMKADRFPLLNTPKVHMYLDSISKQARQMEEYIVGHCESYFQDRKDAQQEHRTIVLTNPRAMDVAVTQRYVAQIHSQQHIDVCSLESGYLQAIFIREGQAVKKGDLMFTIVPVFYKARLEAELAEARLAELEFQNTENLFTGKAVVSRNAMLLFKARLDRAKAKADLARAEFNFTEVKAPFDGIVDSLHQREGSLIKQGDILTTLSDNSLMWVYFNVPEASYLDYMARQKQDRDDQKIELELVNHNEYPYHGKIGAIEATFNNETGNIAFRADFVNPHGLLRHGQTGMILVIRTLRNALIIPQRAVFESLDKRYVYVVDKDDVAHQREITIQDDQDDFYVIKKGVGLGDRIVLEAIGQVRDGHKVEYEFRLPGQVLAAQQQKAE